MSKNTLYQLLLLSFVVFVNSVIIEQSLLKNFKTKEKINIMVDFVSPQQNLNTLNLLNVEDRDQQIKNVVDSLQSFTKGSQTKSVKFLEENSIKYQSFWISNQIYIKDATESLVKTLSEDPEVEHIAEELIITLDPVEFSSSNQSQPKQSSEWGVAKIGAPTVWNSNRRGEGVIVGGIDSGVRYTHQALRSNFRSSNGWYNPIENTSTPYDDNGHGTHTMGTIVGQFGIGVAPGATWIACRACHNELGCFQNALLECAQWITCPSRNNNDCQAPHIVSNSWGGGQNSGWFNNAINAWIKAGIVPVFAIGNEGIEGCSSASSPGDQLGNNLLSVGSTAEDDTLSYFSSRGPTSGAFKPFISAPGQKIYSATNLRDTSYATLQGTSMATPHVAGAVALLLSDKPLQNSSYVNLLTAIAKGADTQGLIPPNTNCNGNDRIYPNNAFGYGRLNVVASLEQWRNLTSASSNTTPFFVPILTICIINFLLQ